MEKDRNCELNEEVLENVDGGAGLWPGLEKSTKSGMWPGLEKNTEGGMWPGLEKNTEGGMWPGLEKSEI